MSTPKLTKKQKKSLAFRERKSGKSKSKNESTDHDEGFHDLPTLDGEDADYEADDSTLVEQPQETQRTNKGKAKAQAGEGGAAGDGERAQTQPKTGKKRKREEAEENAAEVSAVKKRKDNSSKQRFILFLGNLKYTTSKEAIAAHFAGCGACT
jgi:nucleolar protein 6